MVIQTTKALVIRSHPLGKTATAKVRLMVWFTCITVVVLQLLSMFTSPDPVAKVASDGLYIILNEVVDVLNSKSHAIIKVGICWIM